MMETNSLHIVSNSCTNDDSKSAAATAASSMSTSTPAAAVGQQSSSSTPSNAGITSGSSSAATAKMKNRRASAKQQIAMTWAIRRAEGSKRRESSLQPQQQQRRSSKLEHSPSFPTLCYVLRKAWLDVTKNTIEMTTDNNNNSSSNSNNKLGSQSSLSRQSSSLSLSRQSSSLSPSRQSSSLSLSRQSSSPSLSRQSSSPSLSRQSSSSLSVATSSTRSISSGSVPKKTQQQQQRRLSAENQISIDDGAAKTRCSASYRTFPSVLTILQADALVQQVEFLKKQQTVLPESSDATVDSQVLAVLPAGYDWNRALVKMARSRQRAFLLLDLRALVHKLVLWKKLYSGITFLYNVQTNSDEKLLQVLERSELVHLVTATKWDVERWLSIQSNRYEKTQEQQRRKSGDIPSSKTKTTDASVSTFDLYDCTTVTGKPDGYLRKLLFETDADTVAVDGPDEIFRVHKTVNRIWKRRRRQQQQQHPSKQDQDECNTALQHPKKILNFVLRLPLSAKCWKDSVARTIKSIDDVNCTSAGRKDSHIQSTLVGISLHVKDIATVVETNKTNDGCQQEGEDGLQEMKQQQQLAVQDLLQFLEHHELSKDSTTANDIAGSFRIDLTGITNTSLLDLWVSWWRDLRQHRPNLKLTVDTTEMLVAPAGALCTRIIGVKKVEENCGENNQIRRHYYIDDGCYGSLYNHQGDDAASSPMPLFPSPSLSSSSGTYLSTVWGPTCDGLDRVCQSITLPDMQRDDWLVFPNAAASSSHGLSTAFNGFSPPDIAYCVLGYFGGK